MKEQVKYVTGADWAKIQAKAWVDEAFRIALETNPIETIRNDPDVGVEFDRLFCFPEKPTNFSEEKLGHIASGEEDAIVIPYTCLCVCM